MVSGSPAKRQNVPVLILAGGLGTRISEESQLKPKPMLEIGDLPILIHIMRGYYAHGFDDFVICAGYKAWELKSYFLNYAFRLNHLVIDHRALGREDHRRDQSPAEVIGRNAAQEKWRVRVFDTGVECMTGGRVARALDLMEGEGFDDFALTYGDGLSDVDLRAELAFHREQGKTGTVLGVVPSARFGELDADPARSPRVSGFLEKPVSKQAWVSGGFFFFKRGFRSRLSDDAGCVLEREPLAKLAGSGELVMHAHRGFWHPMDTLRDKVYLQSLWDSGKAPWLAR